MTATVSRRRLGVLALAIATVGISACAPRVTRISPDQAIDLSGRGYLVYRARFRSPMVGTLPTELLEDFFHALSDHGRFNLHLDARRGRNAHHVAEALFKATARALRTAVALDPRVAGIPSTKGTL